MSKLSKELKSQFRIGIDVMGGDISPISLLKEILPNLEEHKETQFFVFSTQEVKNSFQSSFIQWVNCVDIVHMHENPLTAIKRKKESSLLLGIDYLKNKTIDALVTLGNTGALMLSATLNLPLLKEVERPALLALIPTHKKNLAVLDVGANISCKPSHLLQFAKMGIAFQKAQGMAKPRVGLLNIGTEENKGTLELREAYQLLTSMETDHSSFIGNIEGRDVFLGDIDVLVTDGFTGNIFLKTTEGFASFLLTHLEKTYGNSVYKELKSLLLYTEYPGALLCGIEDIVIKCHGSSDGYGFFNAIKGAEYLLKHNFIEKIKAQF